MIVEIFKTNVQKDTDKNHVTASIQNQFPNHKINFDLEDCDKILRVEGNPLDSKSIIQYVNSLGYICILLD